MTHTQGFSFTRLSRPLNLDSLFATFRWIFAQGSCSYTFTVPGKPAPQGSKTYKGNGVMVDSCKRLKSWRKLARKTAEDSRPSHWDSRLNSPICVSVEFVFARANSQFVNNTPGPGRLKPNAPQHCIKRIGDTDKLCRSLLDSLSGVAYVDDAQVIGIVALKRFANDREQPCTIVNVTALN
mgnify:CR=1 FL=1|tara:strand:+ start:4479 stop:5021 length:543 start_codon:yes stop_codon:yes gene_type:complete